MDFFSGSATTAQAVMQTEIDKNIHLKYILVQIPDKCEETSEAFKAGYTTICEIGKERIRRAAEKIKRDYPGEQYDFGFRVFALDDSNMNDVYYSPAEYSQTMLAMLEENVKSDRSDLDLLFGCLLDWGQPLSLPYSTECIDSYAVHDYNHGELMACFQKNIPESVIRKIAQKRPKRVVFRDSSFSGSPAKINVGEIFKLLSPSTEIKVI